MVAVLGGALLAGSLAAGQPWLDRHILPSFFLPRPWYVHAETAARAGMAVLGIALLLRARPRRGPRRHGSSQRVLHVALAALLALGAAELVLRLAHPRPVGWLVPADEEPLRRSDPRLGWVLVPNRTGRATMGGRGVEYATDPAGYRVRRADEPVDPERPTIVFTGESIVFGEGLAWDESIPARVGAALGMQSANLAVHGFASDQAYLRLAGELPRFRRPVAVVTVFMPALFGRNLDGSRPHLEPGLIWRPGEPHSRLGSLAALLVPYRSEATVERGIAMTRDVLAATSDLARSRGAVPLVVVPQFWQEDALERSLRERILEQPHVPYLLVEAGPDWRLPRALHPNAGAARRIAGAIAARLHAELGTTR